MEFRAGKYRSLIFILSGRHSFWAGGQQATQDTFILGTRIAAHNWVDRHSVHHTSSSTVELPEYKTATIGEIISSDENKCAWCDCILLSTAIKNEVNFLWQNEVYVVQKSCVVGPHRLNAGRICYGIGTDSPWCSKGLVTFHAQWVIWSKALVILDLFNIISWV